jgi:hypothetical protein
VSVLLNSGVAIVLQIAVLSSIAMDQPQAVATTLVSRLQRASSKCKEAVDQFGDGLWVLRDERMTRARELREPGARNSVHQL